MLLDRSKLLKRWRINHGYCNLDRLILFGEHAGGDGTWRLSNGECYAKRWGSRLDIVGCFVGTQASIKRFFTGTLTQIQYVIQRANYEPHICSSSLHAADASPATHRDSVADNIPTI